MNPTAGTKNKQTRKMESMMEKKRSGRDAEPNRLNKQTVECCDQFNLAINSESKKRETQSDVYAFGGARHINQFLFRYFISSKNK